jgi:predicted 2-oxoglutarate/Fe(II)-dependent dioxygenase YbiX
MTSNYELIAEKIVHFPYALKTPADVVELLENTNSIAAGEWLPWLSGGSNNIHQYGLMKELTPSRNNLELDAKVKDQVSNVISNIYTALDNSFADYYRAIGLPEKTATTWASKYRDSGLDHIAIKKYFDSEHLGPHPDSELLDPVEYTASIYFNDDYEGGELGFPGRGVAIKPTPGSIVIFPAAFLHESRPLNSGVKYVTNVLGSIPQKIIDAANKE